MKINLLPQEPVGFATPLLAVFAVDVAMDKATDPVPALLATSDLLTDAAVKIMSGGEFKAGLGETLLLHLPGNLKAERLLIVGLGKARQLSAEKVQKGAGTAVRVAKSRRLADIAIIFPEDHALSDEHLPNLPSLLTARALAVGAALGEKDWDTYKTDRKETAIQTLNVLAARTERSASAEIQQGLDEGKVLADAQNFARALVNEPGNVLTPTVLGQRASAMCSEMGLKCEVHSTEKLRELKMGAFAAVAQGSAQPPALIVMTYEPEGGIAPNAPVLGLVGKGITFDTGGISIKSADGMEKMKYDMSGAAAMIGSMRAIAELKPKVKVIGVVCSAENMPDGGAFKPGDVVTAMSGTTIDIINTDAEGRLVLADGLHYAKTLGCTHLINAATLTGAVAVALGKLNAGLFSNDDATAERFKSALQSSGEKFWQLPCTEDYADQIKSPIADLMNTGGSRLGGAITAAMFLKHFAGDTPWIHLDIAALAWEDEQRPWIAKGPTGVAVRSIVDWVRSYGA